MPITVESGETLVKVESGETLVKPAAPYGIRIEVNGSPVTPTAWAWSGNTLQATLVTPFSSEAFEE